MTVVDGPIDYILPGKGMPTTNICNQSFCDYAGPYYGSLGYILAFKIYDSIRQCNRGKAEGSNIDYIKAGIGSLIVIYSFVMLVIMRENVIENNVNTKDIDVTKLLSHLFTLVFMMCIICSMVINSFKSMNIPSPATNVAEKINNLPPFVLKSLYTIIPSIILYFVITLFFGISFLNMKGDLNEEGDKIPQCEKQGFLNILYEPLGITILIMTIVNMIINFAGQKINNIYYIILIVSVLITMINKLTENNFTCIF